MTEYSKEQLTAIESYRKDLNSLDEAFPYEFFEIVNYESGKTLGYAFSKVHTDLWKSSPKLLDALIDLYADWLNHVTERGSFTENLSEKVNNAILEAQGRVARQKINYQKLIIDEIKYLDRFKLCGSLNEHQMKDIYSRQLELQKFLV